MMMQQLIADAYEDAQTMWDENKDLPRGDDDDVRYLSISITPPYARTRLLPPLPL